MRRPALVTAAVAVVALLLPTGSAAALGGTITGSFLCENTLVTATTPATAGTTINAASQSFATTVALPDSAEATVGASAQVTIAPSSTGTMPLSPPVSLSGVSITALSVELDVYRSPTNAATGIAATRDMTSGTRTLDIAVPQGQPGGAPWVLPEPFDVTVPVPGTAGQRAWVRVKSFGFSWSKPGAFTGTTTCRLAADLFTPTPPTPTTNVEQPIFGALTPLSLQYPVVLTDVDLSGSESQIRAEFADRVTFTGTTTSPSTDDTCTVTDPRGCDTGQLVSGTLVAGSLAQSAAPAGDNPSSTAIVLRKQASTAGPPYTGSPSVTVSAGPQVMEGPLNPVTVTDVRGGTAGWSLTAQLTGPFLEVGLGSMDESQARLVGITCSPLQGSASNVTGSGGTLDTAVTLCGVDAGMDDSDGQSGSGQYTVTGRVELTVPPFQKAGEYTSTLQITLA